MMINVELDDSYNWLAKEFVEFLCRELSILPLKLDIVTENMDENIGQCIDVDKDSYLILVKTLNRDIDRVFITIAHEMIHVKQYMTQELGRILDEQSHIPYDDRWWEIEAYNMSFPLVKKFSEMLNFFSKPLDV